MTPELSISRLQSLASRLRLGVPKFDMGDWSSCALSVATEMPEFKLAGLRKMIIVNTSPNYYVPVFGGLTCYSAAAEFFGIDDYTALELFSPDYYFLAARFTRPKDVAKRIDRVIKNMNLAFEDLAQAEQQLEASMSIFV